MASTRLTPVRVVETPESTSLFLQIAALDREAWGEGLGARFVPDGEHAWRVWAEYAYVAAAVGEDGCVTGALVAFPTEDPRLYFLHKLFVAAGSRRTGTGRALFEHLCVHLDRRGAQVVFSTDPRNTAMIDLSDSFGFRTIGLVGEYYGPGKDRLLRARTPQSRDAAKV